jgi:hypothetical protein
LAEKGDLHAFIRRGERRREEGRGGEGREGKGEKYKHNTLKPK